jgi:hypothetical protein
MVNACFTVLKGIISVKVLINGSSYWILSHTNELIKFVIFFISFFVLIQHILLNFHT